MRPPLAPALLTALLLAAAPALAQGGPSPDTAGLNDALTRFPPLILGANVHAAAANEAVPRPCPARGARVEQKGGPTLVFEGIAGTDPTLCHMRVGPDEMDAWFGIWGTTWPGAVPAAKALAQIMHSKTGEVAAFDTVAVPGVAEWHDLIRNDGVEDLNLLGHTYHTLKLAHYREGYSGNIYRSVATLWVDVPTGLPVYATYNHIAGRPELDSPLIPTAIVPATAP